MKDKAPKTKKPIFKKWWFWILIVVIVAAIFGNMDKNTLPETSANKFLSEVKTAIQSTISSNDESIINIALNNEDLCITVDLSKANPEPLTMEDLAISRTSSITDAILELTDYDNQWNTITIDFGDVGKITNKKDDVQENDFGGRYFPSENFILK